MSKSTQVDDFSRRQFLNSGMAAAGIVAGAECSLAQEPRKNRSDKLRLAFVGCGGQGGGNLGVFIKMPQVQIVALCDVDARRLAAAANQVPDASTHRDFRKMFDTEKNIDAVVVSTPDHTHAAVTMRAIKEGKHVYCEKPLTRTIFEARTVADAARKAGVITQMGNQGMDSEGNRQIKEWLADGAIGEVREVHVWSDRPTHSGKLPLWWPQGFERPTDQPNVPDELDWDLWLGPARQRAYHPAYCPFVWRGWWDFGSGGLGDMGIHNLAPVFDALQLGAPESVRASSTPLFPETVPQAAIVHYQFPARGDRPPVKLHWYDGGLLPAVPDVLDKGVELPRDDGILFVGDKGHMLVRGAGGRQPTLIPSSRDREYKRPTASLPRSIGHRAEWVAACLGEGTGTASNFSFAGPLTEAVLVGSICIRCGGEKLMWDSQGLRFIDNSKATAMVHYDYREGWQL